MIKKLEPEHYLKRFYSMSAEEKDSYLSRVRNWTGGDKSLLLPRGEDRVSVFQNVMACASAWSDSEIKAWNEGSVLITALVGMIESGWLPDGIYVKSARRAIRFIATALDDINRQYSSVTYPREGERESRVAYFGPDAVDTRKVKGTMEKAKAAQAEGYAAALEAGKTADAATRELWSFRPKHIDQYIHLLPESTQRKAAKIKGLFMELDMARENARLLSEDPHASSGDIAHFAKQAQAKDDAIRAIFREIDSEWAKVVESGRVVVDDLGVARLVEKTEKEEGPSGGEEPAKEEPGGEAPGTVAEEEPAGEEGHSGEAEGTVTEDDETGTTEEEPEGEEEEPAGETAGTVTEAEETVTEDAGAGERVAVIRRWLTDVRKKGTAKHDEKWVALYIELVSKGGMEAVTPAVTSAAEHYNIDLTQIQLP